MFRLQQCWSVLLCPVGRRHRNRNSSAFLQGGTAKVLYCPYVFAYLIPKIGTDQHFCRGGLQKWCIPIFPVQAPIKSCAVLKNSEKPILGNFGPGSHHSSGGLVFRDSTALHWYPHQNNRDSFSIFAVEDCKNAVLSQFLCLLGRKK